MCDHEPLSEVGRCLSTPFVCIENHQFSYQFQFGSGVEGCCIFFYFTQIESSGRKGVPWSSGTYTHTSCAPCPCCPLPGARDALLLLQVQDQSTGKLLKVRNLESGRSRLEQSFWIFKEAGHTNRRRGWTVSKCWECREEGGRHSCCLHSGYWSEKAHLQSSLQRNDFLRAFFLWFSHLWGRRTPHATEM